jgi:hypothetical protein
MILVERLVRRTVSVSRASRSKTEKGHLRVALLLFGRPDTIPFRHNREKFWTRVATHTLQDCPVMNLVPISVEPGIRILKRLHGQISDEFGGNVHGARNLIYNVHPECTRPALLGSFRCGSQ